MPTAIRLTPGVPGTGVVTSLNAATATGAGTDFDFGGIFASWTVQGVITGAPTGLVFKVEGSLDGTNWFDLVTNSGNAGGGYSVTGKPARYARANLTTLTGGTAPTVTAYIAGC